MTAISKLLTLEEYLNYDDGTDTNEDRDHRYKRSEYAARGISEYWIINPQTNRVSVLILVEGLYEEMIFEGSTVIASSTFPELRLTAQQVLTAGE